MLFDKLLLMEDGSIKNEVFLHTVLVDCLVSRFHPVADLGGFLGFHGIPFLARLVWV